MWLRPLPVFSSYFQLTCCTFILWICQKCGQNKKKTKWKFNGKKLISSVGKRNTTKICRKRALNGLTALEFHNLLNPRSELTSRSRYNLSLMVCTTFKWQMKILCESLKYFIISMPHLFRCVWDTCAHSSAQTFPFYFICPFYYRSVCTLLCLSFFLLMAFFMAIYSDWSIAKSIRWFCVE